MNNILIFFIASLLFVMSFWVLKNVVKDEKIIKLTGMVGGWLILFISLGIFITGVLNLPMPKIKGIGLGMEAPHHHGCNIDKLPISQPESGPKG